MAWGAQAPRCWLCLGGVSVPSPRKDAATYRARPFPEFESASQVPPTWCGQSAAFRALPGTRMPHWHEALSQQPDLLSGVQSKRTKKVGITGKYGTRYGASLRKIIKKMEVSQHSKYFCPFCGKVCPICQAKLAVSAMRKVVCGLGAALRLCQSRTCVHLKTAL